MFLQNPTFENVCSTKTGFVRTEFIYTLFCIHCCILNRNSFSGVVDEPTFVMLRHKNTFCWPDPTFKNVFSTKICFLVVLNLIARASVLIRVAPFSKAKPGKRKGVR